MGSAAPCEARHARRAWSSSRPAAYVGKGVAWCSSACRKVRELKVVKESGGGTSPQHEVYPLAMYRAAKPSTCAGTKARHGQPMIALSPAAPPTPQKVATGGRPVGGGGAPYREGHAEPWVPAVKGTGNRRARRSAVGRQRGGHASSRHGRLCNATGDRAKFLTVKGRVRLTVRLFPMPPRPAGDVRVRVEGDHQPVSRHAVRQLVERVEHRAGAVGVLLAVEAREEVRLVRWGIGGVAG